MTDEQTKRIEQECEVVDGEERFADMLDEVYGQVGIGELTFSPSQIIKELDPVAFRCGVSDMLAGEEYTEVAGEYYLTTDVDDVLADMDDEDDS